MEDPVFDEMLADLACTAPAAVPSVSPEARSHLDSVFGSYADDSNTCALRCVVFSDLLTRWRLVSVSHLLTSASDLASPSHVRHATSSANAQRSIPAVGSTLSQRFMFVRRLTIDEADLEPGALAPLSASLQLLPAPDPSSDDDDLLPPLVSRSLSDAVLTAALITEQLGDAEVLSTTGARSQYTVPVRRPVACRLGAPLTLARVGLR